MVLQRPRYRRVDRVALKTSEAAHQDVRPFWALPDELDRRGQTIVLTVLAVLCLPLLVVPPETSMDTAALFDDPTRDRLAEETAAEGLSGFLVVRVRHDDSGPLTTNLSRVHHLMDIEAGALSGEGAYAFDVEHTWIERVETPFARWSTAFASQNRSMVGAETWSGVLQPPLKGGWCGDDATEAEQRALEASLLLLPKGSNMGVACPAFAGASPTVPPSANEVLWMVWMDSEEPPTDWLELQRWADKVSANTPYTFEPGGVNMLFKESEGIAKEDLSVVLPVAAALLTALLLFVLRRPMTVAKTLGSVGLVVAAELGLLTLFGHRFTVIDAIAIPIIMAVAVDGAFWYSVSSRSKEEVRRLLLVAMVTTVGAVSLALFSPIRAQRGLALVMIIGIFLDWFVTRYVLEHSYLATRRAPPRPPAKASPLAFSPITWFWPVALILLAAVAATSPPGVEVLDIDQFLPEDDPSLDELDDLRGTYMIASSTLVQIVVDVEEDDVPRRLVDFTTQLSQHPTLIAYDTGTARQPLVLGIPDADPHDHDTMSTWYDRHRGAILLDDPVLRNEGEMTGIHLIAIIDGEDADGAYLFQQDLIDLMEHNGLTGVVGGDLVVGIALAKAFEATRVVQVLAAGAAVFVLAGVVTDSRHQALRIAIGTVAVGIAVDGLASHMGGRGVNTAPAVLLGMGFAADYLAHASAGHRTTSRDAFARWGAALSSVSVFAVVGLSRYPPAQDTGQLLAISVLLSVMLAAILARVPVRDRPVLSDEEA